MNKNKLIRVICTLIAVLVQVYVFKKLFGLNEFKDVSEIIAYTVAPALGYSYFMILGLRKKVRFDKLKSFSMQLGVLIAVQLVIFIILCSFMKINIIYMLAGFLPGVVLTLLFVYMINFKGYVKFSSLYASAAVTVLINIITVNVMELTKLSYQVTIVTVTLVNLIMLAVTCGLMYKSYTTEYIEYE
ncbi:hypothetical protein RZE82_00505 [Mollicutes bacterium LVI A0039]|nr:hypothetical protein RZE82_00505 [Mollicutes bacterium LVI A0039]